MKQKYEVTVIGISERRFKVNAKSAQQAIKLAGCIYLNTDLIAFDDKETDIVDIEAVALEEPKTFYHNSTEFPDECGIDDVVGSSI